MKNDWYPKEAVLVVGSDKVAYSLVVCLLKAGHPVKLYTEHPNIARERIRIHLDDLYQFQSTYFSLPSDFIITSQLENKLDEKIAIIVTQESSTEKKTILAKIEKFMSSEAILAINTESISLQDIQQGTVHKERIIGANWTEPVHTTKFLEVITNKYSSKTLVDKFYGLAKHLWKKDPYILHGGMGIRTKMMCAMVREAFHLIEKGYVTPEDVDRACRNDAGYYFPFAGNFRYMDLMGAYIYGLVMQELNPNLSKSRSIPDFFHEIISKGNRGMESGKGFFEYEKDEVAHWDIMFRRFSYQIQEIIDKYPFKYLEEGKVIQVKK